MLLSSYFLLLEKNIVPISKSLSQPPLFLLEKETHSVVQDGLSLTCILLPLHPKYSDDRYVPLYLVVVISSISG